MGPLDFGLGSHPPWKFLRVPWWGFNWVFLRASRIFIPICTHLVPGFPHTILFLWGKKNLQGWGCKRGAKLRESPHPLPHGPTHITAGRLQLPLTSWRW